MNLIQSEEFCSISIGRSCDKSSVFDAAFSPYSDEADEIEGNVSEHGQIVGGGLCSCP
jgi:hypothetical protein